MRIVSTVRGMQALARKNQQAGIASGLVPTMGCLHAGHLSLVKRARRAVGPNGTVVLSIYVNPTQFGPKEDFKKYPRDLGRDARLCRGAGVDVVFAPSDEEMYPSGSKEGFSTYVVEEGLSQSMEGHSRPTHFRGVATVVAKLFNIVQPTLAVFGQKDYQQAAVIGRITRDLNFGVKIVVAATVREPDGLALSSRNQYLSGEERQQATCLWRAIQLARTRVRMASDDVSAADLNAELRRSIRAHPSAKVDYISFFDAASLQPQERVSRGTHLALAVFIGKTRLIDNATL
jgi:pantoate--beta-alanine ligase